MAKYLRVVPPRFAQIALSIDTLLDMSTLSIKDVTGRLKAVEDRAEAPARTTAGARRPAAAHGGAVGGTPA